YTVSNDKRTIAGSQTVTVAINDKDNYEWVNGGVADLSFTFTIGKAKVVAPTETTETYTYTGEEQTYEFATAGSSALYTVSNDKRTVAGSQTVTVAINDKDNYEWVNGGDADLSFTFTIGKAKVTAPTETTETYTYSGEEQTYDFAADGDTDLFTVSNDTRTNAGEQTVTVSLKDSDNYEWTTGGIDAKTFTFTIAAKTLTVKTYIDEETEYELTYGDAVPAANLFTFEAEGIVEGDENDVNGALEVQPVNAYTQYAGVGDYVYTTGVKSGSTLNANYSLGTPGTAKIVVTAKALTLTAAYNGGTVTLTCGGIVNNDAITLTYSVDGVALSSNVYTAVAADVPKEEIVAAVTTTNANYSAAELDLNAVYSVTFEFTEAFSTAAGLPAVQYVFDGQKAAEPAEPTFDNNHVFLYWALEDEEYDFATAVEDDLVLVAAWEKMVYEFRFRALNDGADYATGLYRELKWENGAFVLADTAATFPFTKNTEIPTVGSIGAFRVTSWVKAVKVDNEYTYTTVTAFDVLVSTETDADAYYIAIMTLDLGLGDINGDGSVTAEDIILMKKCLVGVKFTTITDAAAAWAKIGEPVPANGYLYTFLWDVNSDGFKDTRDVFIARAALATGHGYEICSDVTVNGVYHTNDVIVGPNDVAFDGQVVFVDDAEALGAALAAGKRVGMIADIALEDGAFITDKDIYIDLGGHTLSIGEFTVETIGTVTVKNGKLDIETSFTIDGSSIDFANVKDGEDIDLVISGVTHAFITAE
ncbi:MAG: dockerin type I repeat-containing protein, partial [Clostridia bacterium]|nr:dockerin type I repeat-containing protein [Clostridia bacterium]